LATDWDDVVKLASENSHVVALGETGLDNYWKEVLFPLQQDYFDRHLRLSQQLQLPFIVHQRECMAEILAMLRDAALRPVKGVSDLLHRHGRRSGRVPRFGFAYQLRGNGDVQEVRRSAGRGQDDPSGPILVETDSPISPRAFRGKRPNEPARVIHTAECPQRFAKSLADFARQTTANACALFAVRVTL
jgi:TatD DNase family protein